jgi:anthraniloyl-CoA monooxygenase
VKIACIGGGPAGLYLALLMKGRDPRHEVTVLERNGPDDTFGWGVVFSDETLDGFREADEPSHRAITRRFATWDAIDTHVKGQVIRSRGHGFAGISRRVLLNLLQARCEELGVRIAYRREVEGPHEVRDADLVVAADGVNSRTRAALEAHLRPAIERGRSRYIWLGTPRRFDAFTFIIRETEHGVFQVHAYRFEEGSSTFIVECDEESFRRAGFDRQPVEESVRACERLFAPELDGAPLLTNKSSWLQFPMIRCARWHHENVVLLGDAVHTAHFSIGSGTKLAMEDAIALAAALREQPTVPQALAAYDAARRPVVERIQAVARHSQTWFEEIPRHVRHDAATLTFSMLTRSKKVTHGNLKRRDAAYVEAVDRAFVEAEERRLGRPVAEAGAPPPSPMFVPLRLRGLELHNRVVVSPMCQYSAEDGTVSDWHLVHLGSRAIGGAGLVMGEMTDVSADGRITPGCAGMYLPAHVAAWQRVVDFVHRHSAAKIGLQLAHAGRKGATSVPWLGGGTSLPQESRWGLVAPSALAYDATSDVPRAMTRADMDRVREDFVRAARMSLEAGFDLLELHAAHGYLLGSFLSPLSNQRTDAYGGSLEGRMRFPLEVFQAVRAAWPDERPISMRISATDWVPGGFSVDDAVVVARAFKQHGLDVIDISSGGATPESHPEFYGRMYQVPFSDRIRADAGIPTMTVGGITTWDQANTILAARRADLVVLAREHLRDPYFTFHAAEAQGVAGPGLSWPLPYGLVRPRPRG